MIKAPIIEIFSSLQGEGPHVGEKHIFVRFKHCNIHCTFCDELKEEAHELTVKEIYDEIDSIDNNVGPHSTISWTGGEPLLYPQFLQSGMKVAHGLGFKNYLETAGILIKSFQEVLNYTDIVAMDFKLPSVTKEKSFWPEHEEFLKLSIQKEVFVKMVLSREAVLSEFDLGVEIIQKVKPETLLVLQPLSSEEEPQGEAQTYDYLEILRERALQKLPNVRIIPRLHMMLGIQ